MFQINNPKISFILISPENDESSDFENKISCERLCSVLYSKDYSIIPIKEYSNSCHRNSFIGVSSLTDNDEIRKEALDILNFLKLESAVLKYKDQNEPVRIHNSGQEQDLVFDFYSDYLSDRKSYVMEGLSFSFDVKPKFFYPKKKEHLKSGMIVEFFNNNRWNQKTIIDVDSEYEKLYKLLIKYEKLRIVTQN